MITSLVVGGSNGIGLEIANLLKMRGDEVYVLSRNKNNCSGNIIQADLSDPESLVNSVEYIQKNNLCFNYIVFCQKNRDMPNDFETEFQVTLKSTRYLVDTLIPSHMKESGAVIFLGSPAGRYIMSDLPVEYHVCKAALEQMARYYAVQFGKYGITFNCVLPGTVLKDSNRKFYANNPEITDIIKKVSPLGKIGDAKDIANVVNFFCSEHARFITGQTILIDGGQSLLGHESMARNLLGL